MRDLNSALAGLTYNVVSQPGIQSYKGTVIITANDNDNNEPKTGSGQVVIRTTVVADTSNLAATASAVGAGAAATGTSSLLSLFTSLSSRSPRFSRSSHSFRFFFAYDTTNTPL